MRYRRLFLWVEGDDDQRLVQRILESPLKKKFDYVQYVLYAKKEKKYIRNLLRSIRAMGAEYIFFSDNDCPCVTAEKTKITNTHPEVDSEKIQVVVKEIESWYLAGLDRETSKDLGLKIFHTTDSITKEKFDSLKPKRFESRLDFMIEILKRFSLQTAARKNHSFEYFVDKYHIHTSENSCRF